jgi:hypothetical protein
MDQSPAGRLEGKFSGEWKECEEEATEQCEGFWVCKKHAEMWPSKIGTESKIEFQPLFCFARSKDQNEKEIFDMIQDRMRTLLGYAFTKNEITSISTPDSDSLCNLIADLPVWQQSTEVWTVKDFEEVGKNFKLSMADVLGHPNISEADYKTVADALECSKQEKTTIDPVLAFVVLSSLERIDELVELQRAEVVV